MHSMIDPGYYDCPVRRRYEARSLPYNMLADLYAISGPENYSFCEINSVTVSIRCSVPKGFCRNENVPTLSVCLT